MNPFYGKITHTHARARARAQIFFDLF